MLRSAFARRAFGFGRPGDTRTRRQLLRQALAASAGLLLSDAPVSTADKPSQKPRVIIVGAGLAGLACTYELHHAGYAVTVFEARKRLGGRVHTLDDVAAGKTVEGGGEFIGRNHPTWLAYARKFGLQLSEITEREDSKNPVVLDGKVLDEKDARKLFQEMEAGGLLLTQDARPIDADEPWKSPKAKALDRQSVGDAIQALEIGDLGKRGLTAVFTLESGREPAVLSYLATLAVVKGHGLEKFWTDTEVYRCRGGNHQLARKLAAALGTAAFHLETPIRAIRVQKNSVTVRTAGDRTYEADDVVLAVPPSVWPKIAIDPPLPAALAIQMGMSLKYLATVKDRFWQKIGRSPESLNEGEVGWIWEGTDNQPGPGEAVLTAFGGGKGAQTIRAKTADERRRVYHRAFGKVLPGFADHFVKERFLDWPGDPWTRGGYSAFAPGQLTSAGPILHRGLGRLHFAGEHACFKFQGFMEGALNSGVSLSKRLAERDHMTK